MGDREDYAMVVLRDINRQLVDVRRLLLLVASMTPPEEVVSEYREELVIESRRIANDEARLDGEEKP